MKKVTTKQHGSSAVSHGNRVPISVYMQPDLHERLKLTAQREGRTMSNFIEMAIREALRLRRRRSVLEAV